MSMLTIPRKVAAVEYTALRLPFTLLEHRVIGRLDSESKVRLGFEKALGTVDVTVGRALADPSLRHRGAQLSRRADVLSKAVALEEKAEARRKAADAQLQSAQETADRKRDEAQRRAQLEAKQLLERREAEQRAAEQKAEAAADAKLAVIDEQVQASVDHVEEVLGGRVDAIAQRTQARTAKPKAQLKEAAALTGEAARERKSADRLGELASAEKAKRKSS
ncbi:MAG: hypothetical protein M3P04_09545 [Actinomycetota bacterium]|nr:hypothetical protein [Actinomycetota bacterium]